MGDARLKLARPICAIHKPFSHFGFFLVSGILPARPHAGTPLAKFILTAQALGCRLQLEKIEAGMIIFQP